MMNELYHHGVPGMHWGVRRYQNKDGSLTAKGKLHRQVLNAEDWYFNKSNDISSVILLNPSDSVELRKRYKWSEYGA